MQFSKYTHFFDLGDNSVGVFHSLLVRALFLSKEEKSEIDAFLKDGRSLKKAKATADFLYSNYYLVDSEKEDENLYQIVSL